MAARTQSTKRGPKKLWAFAVYIAGDNNLSEFGLSDIKEMCQEGASSRLHVGVEIDTYGDHTGSIRYEVSEPDWTGHAHPIELERLPERNTGDPVVLSDFLKWAAKRFCADNRLYVIWNHGSGFRTVRRDIAYDDFGSSLDMPEIVGAMERAGITPAKPIQILGFDACLMNMVEIVNHFHGLVEIVVGSEQTEPGQGWPYDKVLALLKTAANPAVAGAGIVKAYIDYYRRTRQPNVTQSAVDVKKTEAVMAALSRLGSALAPLLPAARTKLLEARSQAESFEFADYVDLIDLLGLIREKVSNAAVRSATQAAISAAQASILASGTYGAAVKNATGLSVWFPPSQNLYHSYRSKYLALRFATSHRGWVDFLDAYHS